jgi:lipopolysaccharide transport system permease protein
MYMRGLLKGNEFGRMKKSKKLNTDKKYELIIEANKSKLNYWKDIWEYRELFYFLAWRDILVRYKQTVLGIAWSVIRPFLTMVVLTIVFGKIAGLPSGNAPYAIMVYAAMLPWQYFSTSFSDSSNAMISNSNLLTKVYFPRIIIPATTIVVCVIDFLISFAILVILMIYYQYAPGWQIITLPLFLLIATITSLGTGFFISALNVQYRDFKYIVPFIIQFGLYISPVGYSTDTISEKWRFIYSLNPMVGVIDGFRWAILGGNSKIYLPGFILSIFVSLVFLFLGIKTFRKMECVFADIV